MCAATCACSPDARPRRTGPAGARLELHLPVRRRACRRCSCSRTMHAAPGRRVDDRRRQRRPLRCRLGGRRLWRRYRDRLGPSPRHQFGGGRKRPKTGPETGDGDPARDDDDNQPLTHQIPPYSQHRRRRTRRKALASRSAGRVEARRREQRLSLVPELTSRVEIKAFFGALANPERAARIGSPFGANRLRGCASRHKKRPCASTRFRVQHRLRHRSSPKVLTRTGSGFGSCPTPAIAMQQVQALRDSPTPFCRYPVGCDQILVAARLPGAEDQGPQARSRGMSARLA
jgi:hypothetical protein